MCLFSLPLALAACVIFFSFFPYLTYLCGTFYCSLFILSCRRSCSSFCMPDGNCESKHATKIIYSDKQCINISAVLPCKWYVVGGKKALRRCITSMNAHFRENVPLTQHIYTTWARTHSLSIFRQSIFSSAVHSSRFLSYTDLRSRKYKGKLKISIHTHGFRDFTLEFYLSTANHLPLSLDISVRSIRNMSNIFQSRIICYGICKLNYVNNNWLQIESSSPKYSWNLLFGADCIILKLVCQSTTGKPGEQFAFGCSISFGFFLTNLTSVYSFRFFRGKQLKVSSNHVNKPSRRNVNHLSNPGSQQCSTTTTTRK